MFLDFLGVKSFDAFFIGGCLRAYNQVKWVLILWERLYSFLKELYLL